MDRENIEIKWTNYAKERLVGKKIESIRYLSKGEQKELMWYKRPIVIKLDDGSLLLPSMDDEGNDGGALFGQSKDGDEWTFPIIN